MIKKIIISIIILFIFCINIFVVNANDNIKKSIDYDVIVKDSNGVILNGSYIDENNEEKSIKVTIPYNEKLNVLYEKYNNGIILGHIKYITEVVTTKVYEEDKETINEENNTDSTYNNDSEDPNITWVRPTPNQKTTEEKNTKYVEVKTKVEVEGDIDLSKCMVSKEFSLNDAIKFKKEKKLMLVNSKGLTLYRGPALAFDKFSKIKPSSIVKSNYGAIAINEEDDKTYWMYIEDNSIKGWVYNDPEENNFANYEKGRILIFDNVKVYRYPFLNASKVDNLPKDIRKSFTYIYENNEQEEWYFVKFENKRGWVRNVAKGINAEIKITSSNGVKLYKKPNLNSNTYDVILPKNLKIKSIYKYSNENDAFYVEYEGKKGWIIQNNDESNFEVNYLKDNVKDPLLDKSADYEKNTDKNINYGLILIILVVIIIIVSVIVIIYAKSKRKNANDFSVSNLNNNQNSNNNLI